MPDLVQRLLDRAYSGKGVDRLCEEAAEEIKRLRVVVDSYAASSFAACKEIAALKERPTLTDAEREAMRDAAESFEYDDQDQECARIAATLRGLLERLGGQNVNDTDRGDAEIARLRLEAAHAEIARLRLTDAEREVIQWAANAMRPDCRATLRGLLERMK